MLLAGDSRWANLPLDREWDPKCSRLVPGQVCRLFFRSTQTSLQSPSPTLTQSPHLSWHPASKLEGSTVRLPGARSQPICCTSASWWGASLLIFHGQSLHPICIQHQTTLVPGATRSHKKHFLGDRLPVTHKTEELPWSPDAADSTGGLFLRYPVN